jgi:hypothetical protein
MEKFEHSAIRHAITKTYNIEFIEYPKGLHASAVDGVAELKGRVIDFRAARGIV